MKRISVIVVSVAAMALALSACGGSDESSDASGLRKGSTGASAVATTTIAPTTSVAAPNTTGGAPSTTKAADRTATSASSTTCGEFRALEGDAEKALIEQILAENPDSPFTGSPNVALGTAKLVCLASTNADKPVAEAAGMVTAH